MIQSSTRMELWLWSAMPSIITFILAVFTLSSKHIPGLAPIMPALPLIPIFYWGTMHAREMPYGFLFALGLAVDAASGLPLGLSSVLYMLFLALLRAQRRFFHKEGFIVKWGYFTLLMGIVFCVQWLLLSFFYSRALPAGAAFIQWGLTACCYPLLHKLFDGISEHIHARRWQLLHGR
ncbi:MAG: rod shape-determining protein MreD [Pseudomonadota bacterium]|nr:rod shape-determining protein MreD [Pseudomonadota bacterium]